MERMRGSEILNGELGIGNGELAAAAGIEAEEMAAGLPIGKREIEKARETLEKYRQGKSALDQRIRENEEWYRMRHWEVAGHGRNPSDPEPTSAWLLNSLINKHSDAMDNYPEPSVLPREGSSTCSTRSPGRPQTGFSQLSFSAKESAPNGFTRRFTSATYCTRSRQLSA